MSAVAAVARSALVQKARQFPARAFLLWGALLAVTGGAVFLWVLAAGGAPRAWQDWHGNLMFWAGVAQDRKRTRLNSSHRYISYAVFCLEKKKHHDSALKVTVTD